MRNTKILLTLGLTLTTLSGAEADTVSEVPLILESTGRGGKAA